ncbi:ATP-binding protein [Mobiluncus mulieris]|uniref:ATP-binding protein n=1 Tax=Mobiluncus mulieris TaxID=2052 RepID=A0A7Y0U1V8_9ACTO|nr:DUF4143 domain-containing protein [Mobiluncus mulieris]NMW65423.1 ATP-binding protein [Mobiluncus mulieris]
MLSPKPYRDRLIDSQITDLLEQFGAVCVQGPKWCGKTWSSLNQAASVTYMQDPAGGFANRNLARLDPKFVLEGAAPHLVDEWQDVPELWDAVRFAVDQNPAKGQFILTGSSTPRRKGVLHSGAGRIATLNMTTMTLFETGDSTGQVRLSELFAAPLKPTKTPGHSLEELIELCTRGGWPANLEAGGGREVAAQYLRSVVDDDAHRVDGVKRDTEKIRGLLVSLARNTATTVSNRKLLQDMRKYQDVTLHENTVGDYLEALERLFLIWEQPSFHPNLRSSRRVLRAAKRHFADCSLAVAALGASPGMLRQDLQTFGYIFESLVEHDLQVYTQALGGKLFHFRDEKGNEIDAVVQLADGRWAAFEIKLGAYRVEEGAQNLLRIAGLFAREANPGAGYQAPGFLAVITGIGDVAYTREDGVLVIPITALRD